MISRTPGDAVAIATKFRNVRRASAATARSAEESR
jgi:hypothetical protein